MSAERIILDERYSWGLLRAAEREGFVQDSGIDTILYQDLAASWRKSRLTQRALAFALLYPDVTLFHYRSEVIDASRLSAAINLEIRPKARLGKTGMVLDDDRREAVRQFRP